MTTTYTKESLQFVCKPTSRPTFRDIDGQTFGYLTVLGYAGRIRPTATFWFCECVCGTIKAIKANLLVNGVQKSCGCMAGSLLSQAHTRHNMSFSPEYKAYTSMKERCCSPNHTSYKDYGERGITVCDRWLESFENFYADMGKRPEGNFQLERIDNDKGYSPDNCKWDTRKRQMRNRRCTIMLTHNDVTQSLGDWCDDLSLPYSILYTRYAAGWEHSRILTEPLRANKHRKPY